jgi:hypothetical protein
MTKLQEALRAMLRLMNGTGVANVDVDGVKYKIIIIRDYEGED